MRPNPELPLIAEDDASKRAVGVSLVQEITAEGGSKEKVLIYAASRSFKSVETRYSTITKELLAVVFAVQKFRTFLIVRDFVITRDHRPLVGLLQRPLLSIENKYLRDLYGQLSQYSFSVKSVPGPSNGFPHWLSRNCVDEMYKYQDHRMSDEKAIEVSHKGNWKKFPPAQDRRPLLFSWQTRLHRGYAHMLKAVEDMNVTWPNISEDIRECVGDCGCAMFKTIVENVRSGKHLKQLYLRIPLMP